MNRAELGEVLLDCVAAARAARGLLELGLHDTNDDGDAVVRVLASIERDLRAAVDGLAGSGDA